MLKFLNIKKSEFKLIFIVSIIAIIFTSLPYLYGYFNSSNEYFYTGAHLAPTDLFVYESYINQIKDGNIMLENLFNNELFPEKNFNIFWLIIGLFAKIFHLSAFLAFHLTRILLIIPCLFAIYFLISYFFKNIVKRKIAFLLISFSSGLGALLSPILNSSYYVEIEKGYYNWPLDLWATESNTFLTLYQSPHFIASLTCLILIFLFFLIALDTNKIKYSLIAGITALFYFNFHPFFLITIFSVISVYLIILLLQKQKKIFLKGMKHLFIIGFISLPSILYHLTKILVDPITQEKAKQNLCATPSLFITIISYGIPLFLAIYGIYYLIKNKKINNKNLFLIVWFIINFILIFCPLIAFQRRLTMGMQIPIVILSVIAIFVIYENIKNLKFISNFKKSKAVTILLLSFIFIFLSLSNLYVITEGFIVSYQKMNYLHTSKIQAMLWIKQNVKKNETIFSSVLIGNIIPAIATKKVYAGHWVETTNSEYKRNKIVWFFRTNKSDKQKKKFLKNSRIDYIFYSNLEQNIGSFNPDEKKYLKKVYDNKDVQIYKVL
ncbi:MAG: hypothetical protein GWO87_01565 [Xanthomonadaceae bacterium]|nr:hypothetical protein [Rhodospirillaceae bacterium]NIA17860.1 hypothetical protein [Xanthomonadaceae bacterium]